ncbi:protein trichome birefringence-like 34 [Henckelia pumila]|uniref:protein trichome birefringence-like 34 n=1 Tax=Henckelia pumila TaxID=405737 RepID=UPI003C6DCD96
MVFENSKTKQSRKDSPGCRQEQIEPEKENSCNLFSGKWVYDNKMNPLYKEGECSFMEDDFACEKYGRKDLKYRNWRWQPHHCDLPRFNGNKFLEKIRGKRIVFVGDSLNRNQWVSLLCLIESSLSSSSSKSVIKTGNLFNLEANEYNASIGFYWSPFLVESNNDHPNIHRLKDRMVRVEAIEKHARLWNDADILVFDSFMWWLGESMQLLWGSFDGTDSIYKKVEKGLRPYEMALNTWSNWLEFNIDRRKTKLFFMSQSPYHEVGKDWDKEQNCYGVKKPIVDEGHWGFTTNRSFMRAAESAIQRLAARGLKVEYLNVTQMSDYRRDAHPSIFREFFRNISQEQLRDPRSYADCVHWCVPGLPDVWNHILYAYIMKS